METPIFPEVDKFGDLRRRPPPVYVLSAEELSLSAALDREDLAQSYMVADKESQQVGKAHIERFKGSSKL